MELEDIDFATELLLTPLPHAESAECNAKCSNMALKPVPAAVEKQFKDYESYRQAPFSRHRTGAQVVSTTVESVYQGWPRTRDEQAKPAREGTNPFC